MHRGALPLLLLNIALLGSAGAQDAPSGGGDSAGTPAAGGESGAAESAGVTGPGVGGPRASARRLRVETSLDGGMSAVETRSAPGERNGVDAVLRLTPTLRMNLQSGQAQGNLAYTASWSRHSNEAVARTQVGPAVSQSLDGQFGAELVPGHVFFDGRVGISQRPRSAFGRQSADPADSGDGNRAEVGNLQLSPSFRTSIGGWARAELRLTAAGTNARDSISGDSTTLGANLVLGSAGDARFGWSLSAAHQTLDQRQTRETTNDRVNLSVSWRPDVDWLFAINAGQEETDVGAIDRQRYDNWGASLRWTPSPRTELSLAGDRRHFGDGWRASFQHRSPRTIWRLSTSRDTLGGPTDGGAGGGQPQTAYQLLFAQFASRTPDPVERDKQVREFLLALGIAPDSLVTGSVVNGSISLQERHEVSAAWTGRRATVTATAFASDTRSIDNVVADPTDEGRVKIWGWSLSMGWKLTPNWSISLLGSRQVTPDNERNAGNDLKSVSIALNGRLGPRSTLGLNGRYSVFNSPRDPYRETALGASLGLRF
jgi:uncharacterized protein (PEP-CTERM system associated)